jgi:hypothetical protein
MDSHSYVTVHSMSLIAVAMMLVLRKIVIVAREGTIVYSRIQELTRKLTNSWTIVRDHAVTQAARLPLFSYPPQCRLNLILIEASLVLWRSLDY